MTDHSARILRVAYNNAHRKILKLHMRASASQMFADNNLLNFEALMRKMSNTFINRLISSDNAIIKVLLDNMVARERMWEYWYSILYYSASAQFWIFYTNCVNLFYTNLFLFIFYIYICFIFTKSIYILYTNLLIIYCNF